MKDNLQAVLGILDFIIPFEVVAAVGLVFAAENIVDSFVTTGEIPIVWVQVYIIVIIIIAGVRYLTADENEIEDLEDDIDEIKT